jgi:putative tryptophan/tyrosine transport system substrate-binding protein
MNPKSGQGCAGLHRRVRADAPRRSTRRKLLFGAIAWPAVVWTSAALAQSTQAPVLIGWLHPGSSESSGHFLAEFKEGLAALGWKENSQIKIEARWGNDRNDRLKASVQELGLLKPRVIVASSLRGVIAAAAANPSTPIVSSSGGDLVAAKLAASLGRPGGIVTGLTNLRGNLAEKYLELLLEAAPGLKRVGLLADANAEMHPLMIAGARHSTARYPIKAWFSIAKPEEVEAAVSRLAEDGVEGLVVLSSFNTQQQRIASLVKARGWPAVCPERAFAEEGALISYSVDTSANHRRAAYYVDRILKGTKPGDLPIEQPTKFELAVNLKTAKALGLTIPKSILVRADRVIE